MHTVQSCDILIHNTSVLSEVIPSNVSESNRLKLNISESNRAKSNALYPSMEVLHHMSIAIKNGRILDVIPSEDALSRFHADEVMDGRSRLWMPGLTDGHMHTGQQLLKGQILDELPMIWTRIMLPFESTLTPEKMRLSAKLAALEMIHAGTTSFVDAGSYFMEHAAEIYLSSGLRGALSYSTMDAPNLPDSIRDTAASAIAKTDALFDAFHGKGNLKVYYSLRSLISCSKDLICRASERANEKQTFLQAHMNEYPNEINFFLEHEKMRPFEYLESVGALSERFLASHCLLLSAHEIELLKKYQVKTVHCPFSNCGKGVPNTPSLLENGISVGLGSDGTAHGGLSLWNEMKIFRSVMNAVHGVSTANPRIMPAETILSMATKNGASLLGESGQLGVIKPSYYADLISIRLNQPHLVPATNLIHLLLESVTAHDVNDMMVCGKWVMKDQTVLTLDEEQILAEAAEYSTQ